MYNAGAFRDTKHGTRDNIFFTLQGVMQEILTVAGDNTYKLPHMGKDKLCQDVKLPICITWCDSNLIASSRAILDSSFVNVDPDVEEPAGPTDTDLFFEEPGDDVVADMSVAELSAAVVDKSVAEHDAAVADTEFANIYHVYEVLW